MDVGEAEERERAEHQNADAGAEVAAVQADGELAHEDDNKQARRRRTLRGVAAEESANGRLEQEERRR